MRALRRFVKRLASWARRQRDEEQLRAEVEEHLTQQTLNTFAPAYRQPRRDGKRH
jgi:hypothetical protein